MKICCQDSVSKSYYAGGLYTSLMIKAGTLTGIAVRQCNIMIPEGVQFVSGFACFIVQIGATHRDMTVFQQNKVFTNNMNIESLNLWIES